MIRQRFLQGLKPIDNSSATFATAPTAQEIVEELCKIQYGTTDAYGNVIPNDPQSKVNKVKALRALKKKATGKDDKDRDCVQAYIDDLMKADDKERRYKKLREELLGRVPKPQSRVERKERAKQKEKEAKKKGNQVNWTPIVVTGIICLSVIVVIFLLRR